MTPPQLSQRALSAAEEHVRQNDGRHSCGQDGNHDRMGTKERSERPH
jgi:hypothetical protein